MRVLVTGGLGFIGSHIVEVLRAAGHEPVVLDRAEPSGSVVEDVPVITADVRDDDAVARALADVDAVCHQAAKVGLGVHLDDMPHYASDNDVGTGVLLAAMARARRRRLVLASSMVVYGEGRYSCPTHGDVPPGPRRREDLDAGLFDPPCPSCGAALEPGLVTEDAPMDPRNAYAVSKVAQEHYARAWARATGGSVIALRYHNVYGPRLPLNTPYAGVAALFRSALHHGKAPTVFEDGRQRRDFVHVRDIARANLLALEELSGEATPGYRAFNVGSGTVRTVGEMARRMAETMGGPAPVVTGEYRLGDVRHITASSDRIRRELGWRPEEEFAEGLAELLRDRPKTVTVP